MYYELIAIRRRSDALVIDILISISTAGERLLCVIQFIGLLSDDCVRSLEAEYPPTIAEESFDKNRSIMRTISIGQWACCKLYR